MIEILFSLLFWFYLTVSSIVLWMIAVCIWLITFLIDPRLKILHYFSSLWGYHYIVLSPIWKTKYEGREKIKKKGVYILTPNHQSFMDIFVLFGLRKHYKWVSKKSLFRIPFMGWNMYMNKYIGLIRGSDPSIDKMKKECGKNLSRGSSILIFPEGTRSKDGNLRPFFSGAARLAVMNSVPLIPIVINGTKDILPKSAWRFHIKGRVRIAVHVLDPIHPDEVSGDYKELNNRLYETMSAELENIRSHRIPELPNPSLRGME
jgi:1-acyl-sn-glycerol-3-phosphate acyltransferase